MASNKRLFYGWFVVAAGFIVGIAGLGLTNNTASLYITPICDSLGISRVEYSMVNTILTICSACMSLFLGGIMKVFKGVRGTLVVSAICMVIGYLLYSNATGLWMLYLGAVFIGCFLGLINTGTWGVVSENWFVEKRNTALGIMLAGSGLGGIVFNPFIGVSLATNGWRTTYMIALAIAAVAMIIGILVVRNTPADKGLEPFGANGQEAKAKEGQEAPEKTGLTLKQGLANPWFWVTLIAVALMTVAVMGSYINFVPHAIASGVEPVQASFILTVVAILLFVGKIVTGAIIDKFGLRLNYTLFLIFIVVALVVLFFATNMMSMPLYYVAAVLLGCCIAFLTVALPAVASVQFGALAAPTFIGIIMCAFNVGNILAGMLPAAVYDATGSYMPMFIANIFLGAIGAVLLIVSISATTKAELAKTEQA